MMQETFCGLMITFEQFLTKIRSTKCQYLYFDIRTVTVCYGQNSSLAPVMMPNIRFSKSNSLFKMHNLEYQNSILMLDTRTFTVFHHIIWSKTIFVISNDIEYQVLNTKLTFKALFKNQNTISIFDILIATAFILLRSKT